MPASCRLFTGIAHLRYKLLCITGDASARPLTGFFSSTMSSPETILNGSDGQANRPPNGEVKKRKRGATRLSCAECRRYACTTLGMTAKTVADFLAIPLLPDSSCVATVQSLVALVLKEGVPRYALMVRCL